jgi:hypothetical protein
LALGVHDVWSHAACGQSHGQKQPLGAGAEHGDFVSRSRAAFADRCERDGEWLDAHGVFVLDRIWQGPYESSRHPRELST